MNKSQTVNLNVTFLEILVAPEMPLTLMFCLTAITCGNKLTFIMEKNMVSIWLSRKVSFSLHKM